MDDLLRFKMKVFEKGRLVQDYISPPYHFSSTKQLADALNHFWISASRVFCEVKVDDANTPYIHLPPREEGYKS